MFQLLFPSSCFSLLTNPPPPPPPRTLRLPTSSPTSYQRLLSDSSCHRGAWLFSGKFCALRAEDCRFESQCSRNVGILGKSFTHSSLYTPRPSSPPPYFSSILFLLSSFFSHPLA